MTSIILPFGNNPSLLRKNFTRRSGKTSLVVPEKLHSSFRKNLARHPGICGANVRDLQPSGIRLPGDSMLLPLPPGEITPGILPSAPPGPPALRFGVQIGSRQICDRTHPVFDPSGALRASKIAPGDFVEPLSFESGTGNPNIKRATSKVALYFIWRARRDSNSRPSGS